MSNNLDLKIKGGCCELCNAQFRSIKTGEPFFHGHPAVCVKCWAELSGFERKLYRRSRGVQIVSTE